MNIRKIIENFFISLKPEEEKRLPIFDSFDACHKSLDNISKSFTAYNMLIPLQKRLVEIVNFQATEQFQIDLKHNPEKVYALRDELLDIQAQLQNLRNKN